MTLGVELLLAVFAAAMAATTAALVRWAAGVRTVPQGATVLFLLAMMAAMFAGAVVYYVHPGTLGLVAGLLLAAGLMSGSVFPLFYAFVREAGRVGAGTTPAAPAGPFPGRGGFVAGAIALVLVNEFLMGWTFLMASGSGMGSLLSSGGLLGLVVRVVDSPWFLFTMAGEMMLTVVLLRRELDGPLRTVLVLQGAIMLLSPPALASGAWVALSVLGGGALMVALFVYVMEHIYRTKQLPARFAAYLVRLLAVYALMMAGLFVWADGGPPGLFALAVVLEMVLYFSAVLRPDAFDPEDRVVWQLRPNWAFQLLAAIFVAELFMGALFDLQLQPAVYAGGFPSLALAGAPLTVLANAASNGFWFVAIVTGSTWFLAMMGIEMGALVAFKYRETRQRETKVRLLLMLGSYAAFATFFPSVYYSALFPNAPAGTSVPFLGWSMGIGSAPLAPSVFTVVLVTYVATGALSMLFGRRAICSVFCTAPLMYQGTTIDAMSSFNRSAPIARKFLSSRFSTAYSVTTGVVMTSLVGASFLSYFDATGRLHVSVGGTDPTVFLFALSFGVMWYVLFVTIPYVGNYNCVTMGWCYTGTIAQAFQRLGVYRLKVRDPAVCRACTTLDCAKSCPVGLVDMPGHFRQTGEFRSSKCCGVGNCAGACPYGNLYLYDIRHWLREKLGHPERPRGETPIPMVPAARPRTAPGAATVTLAPRAAPAGEAR